MIKKHRGITVCITGDIDSGELENVDCLKSYFDTLDRYNVTATIPVTAKAVEDYPDRIEYILRRNHDVAGHGDVHKPFYGSVNKQYNRLKSMINTFKDALDVEITGFRAPWYKHDKNTYLALDKAGLLYDSSKKRFEIAFKKIPFIEKKYLDLKYYKQIKPLLRRIALMYNYLSHVPNHPYFITKRVLEIPVLGISDFSLIDSVRGPKYSPKDCVKISEIWLENLKCLKNGCILVIQAHPGRMSPKYIPAIEHFIKGAQEIGVEFKSLNALIHELDRV